MIDGVVRLEPIINDKGSCLSFAGPAASRTLDDFYAKQTNLVSGSQSGQCCKGHYNHKCTVFDGERLANACSVSFCGDAIINVGGAAPDGAEIVDATGCTLLPGLIDSHVHADPEARRIALIFGVTTVCIMQGFWTREQKAALDRRRDIADALNSLFAVMAPNGHPHEMLPPGTVPRMRMQIDPAELVKYAVTPEDAVKVVNKRVEQNADYIKIMIEDGMIFGKPGTPDLSDEAIAAACREAHRFGKMAVAHAMTKRSTERAIDAGVDGLMHVFIDGPHDWTIIDKIAASGVFVCPTIVAGASVIGDSDGADFARDERVISRLSAEWAAAFAHHIATYPQGRTEHLLQTVKALHDAGVDVVAGCDASQTDVGGMVHGASLHHELQLFVRAGLTPVEALRSATSVPARRFGLHDRGRIVDGARADLLLVEGDPTSRISDTLSTKAVWRQGVRLAPERSA